MKKLLALVLCVMLFVSIVPTSAFADDPPKINLKPAVDQMNSLNTAYAKFAVATVTVNAYNGFKSLADLFPKYLPDFNLGIPPLPAIAKGMALYGADMIARNYNGIVGDVTTPMSPEGVFEKYGYMLVGLYDSVGDCIVGDCAMVEELKTAEIIKNVNEEYAKVAALMPAVPDPVVP